MIVRADFIRKLPDAKRQTERSPELYFRVALEAEPIATLCSCHVIIISLYGFVSLYRYIAVHTGDENKLQESRVIHITAGKHRNVTATNTVNKKLAK